MTQKKLPRLVYECMCDASAWITGTFKICKKSYPFMCHEMQFSYIMTQTYALEVINNLKDFKIFIRHIINKY